MGSRREFIEVADEFSPTIDWFFPHPGNHHSIRSTHIGLEVAANGFSVVFEGPPEQMLEFTTALTDVPAFKRCSTPECVRVIPPSKQWCPWCDQNPMSRMALALETGDTDLLVQAAEAVLAAEAMRDADDR